MKRCVNSDLSFRSIRNPIFIKPQAFISQCKTIMECKMKKLLKNLVPFMICFGLILSSLPALGKEKTVVNWMLFGGLGGVKARIKILEKTNPDLLKRIEIKPEKSAKHGVSKKLRLALAAGGAGLPDMIKLNKIELIEFVEAGVIEDITDRMLPYKDDILPQAWDLGMINGRMYAVANQLKPKIWFYRADIFEAAGVDASMIKTTDDYIAAGKKIQKKFPNAKMWNYGPSMAHYNLEMVLSGNNGRYFDPANGEYVVASDHGVKQAFTDFKKMKDAGIVANISDWTPDWEQAFANGIIVSTLQASWFKRGYLQKWAPDLKGKWKVAIWPAIGGGHGGGATGAGGGVYAILKGQKVEEAFDIISSITFDPDAAKMLFDKRNMEPLIKSAFKKYPELRDPFPYYANNYFDVADEALKNMAYQPLSGNSAKAKIIMNKALARYLLDACYLNACLTKAEKDLKQQIGNAYDY